MMSGFDLRQWCVLAAMSGVLGLVVLDETVVGVALPTIQTDLGMTATGSHWVVNAYLLVFTALVAFGGRLGDMFGHGRLFLVGVALFGAGSLAAGFAPTGAALVSARAVQGAGAALVFPASFAIITASFPTEQRGSALGIQTTAAGCFMAAGPAVGGFFAETISWRWIFWINLPAVAVIAVIAIAVAIHRSETHATPSPHQRTTIDFAGLVTLIVGVSALTIALLEGGDWGWGSPTVLALLVASPIVLGLFGWIETRRDHPLIALELLRIPTFTGCVIAFFMFQFNKIIVFIFVPLYLQKALDFTPLDSGWPLLVAVLPTLATSVVAGRLADRIGTRTPLLIGLLVNGGSLLVIAVGIGLSNFWTIAAALLVWGTTLPLVSVVPRRALLNAVTPQQRGQASGVNLTVQMIGGTVGLALCTAVLVGTGSYLPVFALTGALALAVLPIAWALVERPGAPVQV